MPATKTQNYNKVVQEMMSQPLDIQHESNEVAHDADKIELVKQRKAKLTTGQKIKLIQSNFDNLVANLPDQKMRGKFKAPLQQLEKLIQQTSKVPVKKVIDPTKPTGFNKPFAVTDDTLAFMNLPHGTLVSWADLTTYVNKYIDSNNLKNPEQLKYILPDEPLRRLLNYNPVLDAPLTYTEMQKKFRRCFTHIAARM